MFLSNLVCRYMAVMSCGMFLVITATVADESKESVAIERTERSVENMEAGSQLAKNKAEMVSLRKLLNFTLVGIVLSDTGKSVAIFEDNTTNKQMFHRLDDNVRGMLLTEILEDRVVLTKDSIEIEFRMNSGTSRDTGTTMVEKHDSNTETGEGSTMSDQTDKYDIHLPRIELKVLDELSKMHKFELPVTQLDNGSFRIDSVKKDGPLWKLGFQPGDVIISFNARVPEKGTSIPEAVVQSLSDSDEVLRLEVEQSGKMDVVYLEIDDSSGGQGASE